MIIMIIMTFVWWYMMIVDGEGVARGVDGYGRGDTQYSLIGEL